MNETINITDYLPHRYPFLFVDQVEYIDKEQIKTCKNVSCNEHIFQGHFPNHPVFPGVLILEALAQSACILIAYNFKQSQIDINQYHTYFTKIEQSVFKRLVTPGDQLQMNVRLVNAKELNGNVFYEFEGQAKVDEELACKSIFKAAAVIKGAKS